MVGYVEALSVSTIMEWCCPMLHRLLAMISAVSWILTSGKLIVSNFKKSSEC